MPCDGLGELVLMGEPEMRGLCARVLGSPGGPTLRNGAFPVIEIRAILFRHHRRSQMVDHVPRALRFRFDQP